MSLYTMGGAVARIGEGETAYANRGGAHEIIMVAAWPPDNPEPERHIGWARRFWPALEPNTCGVYVNFMADEAQEQIKAAYGAQRYDRLATLKSKYDPTNFSGTTRTSSPPGDGAASRQ